MLLIVCRFKNSISLKYLLSKQKVIMMKKENGELIQILSKNIKKIRNEKGISQEKLADLANLHRTYIGAIERGEKNITLSTLASLATALNTDAKTLLTT